MKIKVLAAVLWPASLALVAGCMGLAKSYPDRTQYVLSVPPAATAVAPTNSAGAALLVQRALCSPLFARSELVYRTADNVYVPDFYNKLLIAPDDMITDVLIRWATASGYFPGVLTSSERINPGYVLVAWVSELYGDFRDRKAPAAVLGLKLVLLRQRANAPEIVLDKTWLRRVPLDACAAGPLVAGWNQALAEILTEWNQALAGIAWPAAAATDQGAP